MKFKKLASVLTVTALSASFLAACGNSDDADTSVDTETTEAAQAEETPETNIVAGAELQDGEYRIEEMNFSERGWKVFMTMAVEGGEITAVDFDYINEDGMLKTEDEDYNNRMEERVGATVTDAVAQLEEALKGATTISDVEVVSGATSSSHNFINFANQLIQAAQAGNTDTIEINNGAELQDGTYTLEEMNGSSRGGWRAVISMTVEGGEITEVSYDYKDEDGNFKTEDEDANARMEERSGITLTAGVAELEAALVDAGTISEVDVVSGATRSSNSFIKYITQLINAAENGDTTPIKVDNIIVSAE